MSSSDLNLLLTTCWVAIICFVAIIVSCHMIYQLCVIDSSDWINKTYRNLTIMIALLLTSSTIADLMHITLINYILPEDPQIIPAVADELYFIGNITFYVLVLMQISIPFEVKKYIIYLLICLIIIFGIASVIYEVLFFDLISSWNIVTIILMSIDFILNFTILTIFTVKIRHMISDIDPASSEAVQKNVNLISNTVI